MARWSGVRRLARWWRGGLPETLALEDGAAAHFVGSKLLRVVTARPNAGAYRVRREGRQFVETPLAAKRLDDEIGSHA